MNKSTTRLLLSLMDSIYTDMQSVCPKIPVGISVRILNILVYAFYDSGVYVFFNEVINHWEIVK